MGDAIKKIIINNQNKEICLKTVIVP